MKQGFYFMISDPKARRIKAGQAIFLLTIFYSRYVHTAILNRLSLLRQNEQP